MILKIIGSIFILTSSITVGLYYGNIVVYKIRDLLEFKKALAILKAEIEFSHSPLFEACKNISDKTKHPVSNIFLNFAELIYSEDKPSDDLGYLWEYCLMEQVKETYFDSSDIEQFISFGKTLGYLDKGMQINSILITTDYINSKVKILNETSSKNKKLYRSLGLICGVLAVVVFI